MALHRTDRGATKRRSHLAIIGGARPATGIEGTGGVNCCTGSTRRSRIPAPDPRSGSGSF